MCPVIYCFWDHYWGCAGKLLATFLPRFLVTVPEVFVKVNSAQFPSREVMSIVSNT